MCGEDGERTVSDLPTAGNPIPEGARARVATRTQLEAFLKAATAEYDVRVPVLLHDGTRTLARPDEGTLALAGGTILTRPTSVFFPHSERLFSSTERGVEMQPPPDKPLLVAGFTAQDADCLTFIDSFFESGIADDIYSRKRKGSVVIVLSGPCGAGGAFLRMSNGNCDLEWVCNGETYLVVPHSDLGRGLALKIAKAEAPGGTLFAMKRLSDDLPNVVEERIRQASRLLRENKVPDEFWKEIAERCIACTACNLTCPTCTCFDVFDWQCRDRTDRCRLWDSCQLDGFMREASGHNPLGTEALRTRRRIHHKLDADVTRWGKITCFFCGRCDAVCPVQIGMASVCKEIVDRY
jgi:ferredoxin